MIQQNTTTPHEKSQNIVREIYDGLRAIIQPGQVVELRALSALTKRGYSTTVSGYFNNMKLLAGSAAALEQRKPKGIYFTPNPANPALLSRSYNRIRPIRNDDPTTADHDIVELAYLLGDCDPIRPAGISSTDEEHQAAIALAYEIAYTLQDEGWPLPFVADSSNGGHLLWRISLPPSDKPLLQRCLAALDARFSNKIVKVDTTPFNPARIWKLYGTITAKGDNTPERPHRRSEMLLIPDPNDPLVTHEQLEDLARLAPEPEAPAYQRGNYQGQAKPLDLDAFISRYALDLKTPRPYSSGRKWIFRVCPWNSDHTDNSAFLIQFGDGRIVAGCQHNGCSGKQWQDLRIIYEPDAYQRQYRPYQPGTGQSAHHYRPVKMAPMSESAT